MAVHESACSLLPPVHLYPHSILQLLLQPSPFAVFPSSHCFDEANGLVPLPQFSHVSPSPPQYHPNAAPEHEYPASIEQEAEQPSPSFALKSSHFSPPLRIPSPQMGLHVVGFAELQVHPQRILHRVEHHSSPSHSSPPTTLPSPHTAWLPDEPQKLPVVAHPSSTMHVLEQPSPLIVFPSSQSSR